MTIVAGKTEGGNALLSGTAGLGDRALRPIGWNKMAPEVGPDDASTSGVGATAATARSLGAQGIVAYDFENTPLADYQFSANMTVVKDAAFVKRGGQAARVTMTNTSPGSIMPNPDMPLTISRGGRAGWWVYIPDYTKINNFTPYVSLGDRTFTNGVFQTYNIAADTDKQFNGWHFIGFVGTEWGGQDGVGRAGFATLPFAELRLLVTANTVGAQFYVSHAQVNWVAKAKLLITQDDGWDTWWQYGLPFLDSLGIKASMSIVGALIGSNPTWTTEAKLAECYANGHDLVVHGASALNSFGTDALSAADIQANHDYLLTRGYTRGLQYYVWPNGVYQRTPGHQGFINAIKALGYKAARGTTIPRTSKTGPGLTDGRWLMPIIGAQNNESVATIKGRLDDLVTRGEIGNLMYHNITTGTAPVLTDRIYADFVEEIQYAYELEQQGKLDIITASQLTALIDT